MKLYHASTLVVEHPDVVHSRPNLDFGYGFYLTALYDQAVRYAERFTRRGKPAYVSEYAAMDSILLPCTTKPCVMQSASHEEASLPM